MRQILEVLQICAATDGRDYWNASDAVFFMSMMSTRPVVCDVRDVNDGCDVRDVPGVRGVNGVCIFYDVQFVSDIRSN